MARRFTISLIFIFCALASRISSQNETSKWYFGNQAGLDFMTNPPSILTNGAMTVYEGCSSIADAAGNLLMYTDGLTIWNSAHQVMANGSGLFGGNTPCQGSIIIRRPGSTTLYYVFTVMGTNGTAGLNYSIVDMSLASGQGSVTVKNANLYTGTVAEKLTATKHCNGVDYWIVMKDWFQNQATSNFRSFLLTSTGVATTAVISPAWTWTTTNTFYYDLGAMKIAPNGKKLGLAVYGYWNNIQNLNSHSFELWDFDNTTGVVSNSLSLGNYTWTNTNNYNYGYGCEFSPDGTKFYGSRLYNGLNNYGGITQYNLCAGSPSAVAASEYVVLTTTNNINNWVGSMQLAPNGKIYCANYGGVATNQSISIINSPNQAGAACNFNYLGQSVAPKTCYYGLPNFVGSFFAQPPPSPPFTYTVSNSYGCQGVQFVSPVAPNQTVTACSINGFSLTNLVWNFGDPASGVNNTSTAPAPIHNFNTLGQYTVSLIMYYSCGGGTDTLKQVVNVNIPCISVNSTSITCANLGSATVQAISGVGPFSYTWMPTNQTNSVATGLSPGSYTLTVYDQGNNFTYTAQTVFTSLIPLTGNIAATPSVSCFGAQTGTGSVTNLAGGSGSTNVTWTSASSTLTGALTSSLSAGIWSVVATDAVTGCLINQSFFITQPPALSLPLSSNNASICAGGSVQISGLTSGGTPGLLVPYTYTWTNGSLADTHVFTEPLAGTKVYTLSSKDSLGCAITNTISVAVISNPTISVSSTTICPLAIGTITASGASTYTWQNASTATSFTASPASLTQYTVTGMLAACTSTAQGSIDLYPLPNGQITSNSPICNGQNLVLSASGGATYQWSGPNSFTSTLASTSIQNAAPAISGAYNLTVTSAVGCTMSTVSNLTIHPTPTVSAIGSTVCSTGTVNLTANSVANASYLWSGPLNYFSNSQNPQLLQPSLNAAGQYTVQVFSAQSCTNAAVVNVSVTAMPFPIISSPNAPLCAEKTLNLSVNVGASFSWQGPNGFTSNQQNPSISFVQPAASGIYTVVVTLGPCQTSTTYSAGVWPLPQPSISSTSLVCETKTLGLFGSSTGNITSWIWLGPNNFSANGQNQTRTNSTLSYSGVYTLAVTDGNNCSNLITSIITIEQNPIVTAKGATVCLNAAALLQADGAASYSWKGPDYFSSTTKNPNISVTTLPKNGTYTVMGTAANSCTAIATASVLTLQLPQPSIAVSPSVTACPGVTFSLTGLGGKKYFWYGPNNLIYEGKEFNIAPLHQGQTGTYTLVAEDSIGCKNNNTTTLSMYNLPDGYLKVDKVAACVPYCANFTFVPLSSSGAKVGARYSIEGANFGTKFSYCYSKPGDYTFIGHLYDSLTGCVNTHTYNTVAYAQPRADFSFYPKAPDVTTPVELTAQPLDNSGVTQATNSDAYTYQWYIGNKEKKNFSGSSCTYLFEDAGQYAIAMVVKDKNACIDTVMHSIIVDEDFAAFIPNSFTPNNDNLNDYFYPVFRSERFYTLQVFDRWGKMVYNGDQTSKGWDGNFKAELCKNDVYSWKITVSAKDGSQRQLKGYVTLLK